MTSFLVYILRSITRKIFKFEFSSPFYVFSFNFKFVYFTVLKHVYIITLEEEKQLIIMNNYVGYNYYHLAKNNV